VAAGAGWTLPDLAEACVAGGARLLQLRAKAISGGVFLELATRIQAIASSAGAVLIVNDRPDVARLSGAAGVHVGQDDLSPAAARTIVGPGAVVGFSTHTHDQIDAAIDEPVTYIAIGPVFGTATKDTGYAAVGLERVQYAAAALARAAMLTGSPPRGLVAIGGITIDRAADIIRAGAGSVAVISDLLSTGDPRARVREYLDRLAPVGRV
jgi:thiamine-phosphate pyrophosphorylase